MRVHVSDCDFLLQKSFGVEQKSAGSDMLVMSSLKAALPRIKNPGSHQRQGLGGGCGEQHYKEAVPEGQFGTAQIKNQGSKTAWEEGNSAPGGSTSKQKGGEKKEIWKMQTELQTNKLA